MADLFDEAGTAIATEATPLVARTPTPIDVLQSAVQHGLGADELEKLMLMQERWEQNQAQKQFAEAMHLCQQEMPTVFKGSKNKQTNSTYANLEDVQETCRPIYTAHRFSLSYGEADCPLMNHKRTVCDVLHAGGHCKRYYLDLPIDGVGAKGNAIGGMNPVQAAVSTTSYGQRRLLCMIFNVTLSDEDDDGQASAGLITEEQAATLREWIEASGANEAGYLKFLGVPTLANIPQRKYATALQALKDKAATVR